LRPPRQLERESIACIGQSAIAELTQVLLVTWQHINLYGWYKFTRTPAPIDIDTMAAALAQRP
jgi:hypothetical protein